MHAGDILLGRSWQFYKKVIYDCFLHRYSFTHSGRKIVFVTLVPQRTVYWSRGIKKKKEKEKKFERK